MSFSDFHGNTETVHRLREMLARQRLPQAVILAGPAGSGKYTLALMLARAMNCLAPVQTDGLPDFCGQCSNCVRIGEALDLEARFAEAVEAGATAAIQPGGSVRDEEVIQAANQHSIAMVMTGMRHFRH